MNLVKKGLNLIIWSFICALAVIVLVFVAGFIDPAGNGETTIRTLFISSSIVGILGNVLALLGYLFGKMGKNKNFGRAFWCVMLVIICNIVNLIVTAANVVNPTLTMVLGIIVLIADVATSFFAIFACSEAVSEMKKRATVTAIFYLIGLALADLSVALNNGTLNQDALAAMVSIGGLISLIGLIMYVVLIVKTRNRIQ